MNANPRWTRLRKAVERLIGLARSARDRASEPSAPPSVPKPIVASAQVSVAEPTLPSTPILVASPTPDAVPSVAVLSSTSAPASASKPASTPEPHDVPPTPDAAAPATPAPGRFETEAELGLHRMLREAPHRRREFVVYVPAGWSRAVPAPLVVLCHGCKQTPEEFAQGTRIVALADRLGWLVLMPRQATWANPLGCWNWFGPSTMRGGGEAAIIAALVRVVRRRYRADHRRVVAVGISAGAALAVVLGIRYPRYVRAVVAHSGLACGAASSAMAAREVMRRGPQTDVEAIGTQARAEAGGGSAVPLLAIHGAGDTVVAPENAIALVRQYLRFNGHPAASAKPMTPAELPSSDSEHTEYTADGRDVTTREWRIDDRLIVRYVAIAGLGHAWSGGDEALPFNDARAPDASALLGEFLREVLPASQFRATVHPSGA